MNTTSKSSARLPRPMALLLACTMAAIGATGAWAAPKSPAAKKRPPHAVQNALPHFEPEPELDSQERFLLLSVDGFSITQTAYASGTQCDAARKRTLQGNPRLARFVARGELDFDCVADDSALDLPFEASIFDKTTGLRADLSMRTQSECEIGMRQARAANRRYTILATCHQRPAAQALNGGTGGGVAQGA